MKNWIHATLLAVMAVTIALMALPLLAWFLRVAVRNAVGDEAIVRIHDVTALVAVIALILVSMVRVVTVIGRTERWTLLSKSIVAWDGMIATVFLWTVLDNWIAWFRGPWELPVALVTLAGIGIWGITAIMRAKPPPLESGLSDGRGEDAAAEAVTHGGA